MVSAKTKRLEGIDAILRRIIGNEGPVYFSPPSKLEYPCILYEKAKYDPTYADDIRYIDKTRYTITVITRDPDSDLPNKVKRNMSYISHDKAFFSDRLFHDVFTYYE